MIKLNPNPTFSAFCGLTAPGNPVPQQISITFRYMTQEQVTEWFKANEKRKTAEAMSEIVTNWGEPVLNEEGGYDEGKAPLGDDGQPVSYSKGALEMLLKNYSASTVEILRAWQIELSASRVKNS
jgi:hypothetical protein